MSLSDSTPDLPTARNITGSVMSYQGEVPVMYTLDFGPDVSDDNVEAVFRALRSLKDEDRIKALSFTPDGRACVAALDWQPFDEPFRVYNKLRELFVPRLPYCGTMVTSRTLSQDVCELWFAVAGLDVDKYEHFRDGLAHLPNVASAKLCEDTLTFHVALGGTLTTDIGRQLVAKSLEPLGMMLNIPASSRFEVLAVVI